jgi:hypothetical protein
MMEIVEDGPLQFAAADAIQAGLVGGAPPVSELLPGRIQTTLRSETLERIDQASAPVDNGAESVENYCAYSSFRSVALGIRRQA